MPDFKNYILISSLLILLLTGCKNKGNGENISSSDSASSEAVIKLTDSKRLKKNLASGIDSSEYNYPKAISAFYKENQYTPIWNNPEARKDLLKNIENIENDGLFPEDYNASEIKNLLASFNPDATEKNTQLEFLLTDSFFRLAHDLAAGKLNPHDLYKNWGTPLNSINLPEILKRAAEEQNISEILDSLRPHNLIYTGLQKALQNFDRKKFNEEKITKIPSGKLIKPGERNQRIPLVSKRLNELGFYKKSSDTSTLLNEDLEKSIKEFQKTYGLEGDGIIGSSTIDNLNMSQEDRYHQILVNMERWRWYPRDLGKQYIIINIADFQLKLIKGDDTIGTYKTMVGIPSRQTPVFSDEIEYVIYNPTWTIPPTIEKRDVLPGMRRDKNYLKDRSLNVYDKNNNRVDPSTIDWNSSEPLAYTYRQAPGPTNPLGKVKIIYPNKYMVYLHDTSHRSLFSKRNRARSSGCVRVENALQLARYLLNDQPKYNEEKIQEILESGKTTEIPVTKKVSVHHFYWTAYPENNSIKFIDDIYNLDDKLWQYLKPTGN